MNQEVMNTQAAQAAPAKAAKAAPAIVLMDWHGAKPLDIVERIRRSKSGLSVHQLAEVLGRDPSGIYKKAKLGKIPSYRLGGSIVFDPVRTADWLQSQSIGHA